MNLHLANRLKQVSHARVAYRALKIGERLQHEVETSRGQKIHLKVDFLKDRTVQIRISGRGLFAAQYGRAVSSGNGIVTQALRIFSNKRAGRDDDE